ncbi:small GTPase [Pelomyxa schiedti]|nr:small GTPase [Pelomyxa schiedti]
MEGTFGEDYIIGTSSVGSCMEKTLVIHNKRCTFTMLDILGQRDFLSMLPLACDNAVAVLFLFDLSRKETLTSIKEWYRHVRLLNKTAIPLLIGTKWDLFATQPAEFQDEVTKQAKRFAGAMKSPLIYCSSLIGVNISSIFTVILSKAFDLNCTLPRSEQPGHPVFLY